MQDSGIQTPAFGLGTFAEPGGVPFVGIVRQDAVRSLGKSLPKRIEDLLDTWDGVVDALVELADDTAGPWRPLAELEVLLPWTPRQIFQSGANYRQHVIDLAVAHRESDDKRSVEEVATETAEMMDRRAATGSPYLFSGIISSLAGPFDDLVLPAYSERHDWELELAAVIGSPTYAVDPGDALDHVAGYTICNDVTTRDLVFRRDMPEIGTDWIASKGAPGFTPTGPFLVPARYVPDPQDLRVTLDLNGRVMQDESTADMLFDVATLVSTASKLSRLFPGDLVLTGSPAGNGLHHGRLLRAGDVMVGSITGLGSQRVGCVATASPARATVV